MISLLAPSLVEGLLATLLVAQQGIDEKIDRFARELPADDELTAKLRTTLLSPAGKPAVKEQIAAAISDAKKAARESALPNWFKEHFDEAGRLREASKAQAEDLLRELAVFESDMKELRAARDKVVDKLADEPDHNARLKTFMGTDDALLIVYFTHLRLMTGRDEARIEKAILTAIAPIVMADADGKLVTRDDVQDKLDVYLADVDEKVERADAARERLAALIPKLSDDGDTGRIKKALQTPGAVVVIMKAEGGAENPFVERDGKMVLSDEHADKVDKIIAAIDEASRRIANVKGPCDRILARLRDERLRELMKHDCVRHEIAAEIKVADGKTVGTSRSIAEAFDTWIRTICVETDGVWTVQEAVVPKIREGLAKARREAIQKYRRAGDEIRPHADRISDDEPVKAFYRSIYGQVRLAEILTVRFEAVTYTETQGLDLWIARHFEKLDGALVLRFGSRETIEGLIAKADRLRKELEKNDIDPGDK